jgi:hypothetical protein
MVNRGPRLELGIGDQRDRRSAGTSASPEETAAIVAALEQFMRATAPGPRSSADGPDGWRRAAILEGVEREWQGDMPDPWINT